MTEYKLPIEPDGPLWDWHGYKWERKSGAWETEIIPPQSWGDLLTNFGVMKDYPPEPDWLDAPAVLARRDEGDHDEREVFTPAREVEGSWVAMFSTLTYHWSELEDVTPLYPKEGQDA